MKSVKQPLIKSLILCLNICFVILAMACSQLNIASAESNSDPARIQSVSYDARTQSIGLVARPGTAFNSAYQMVKFSQPDRLIIDVPNAFLSTPTRVLPVHQNGIDRVELSQSLGTFYQVVRFTVYANTPDALNNVHVRPSNNTLTISLADGSSSQALSQPPLPPQKTSYSFLDNGNAPDNAHNILQSARFENGMLKLEAQSGDSLVIKNQFTLSGPSRLVIDLANTVLASKSMTMPMDIQSGPLQSVRLGQFDEDTVRIVVETTQPNGLYIIYPGEDKSQIALSPTMTQSMRTLPLENQKVGFVQDVNIEKRDDGTLIRVRTTDPMVRRLVRRGNQIQVDMINIAAKPSFIAYDKQEFPDIKEIRLSPLNATEPNTKLIIQLDNTNVDMDSHLSMDGCTLEISVSPKAVAYSSRSHKMPVLVMPNAISRLQELNDQQNGNAGFTAIPKLRKGAFTVVVDPGHGGKDLGANREGVYEKELNLSVALKLKNALEAKGITVYMTRTTDKFLELSQICAITNEVHPDAFVSVHTNASVNVASNGLETYYLTPQSRDLAYRVHHQAVNNISSPDRGVRTARFYVIHHTNVPAILFEMGYISNAEERAELQTDTRQRATAEAIAQGVVEFLGRSMQAQAPTGDNF